MKKWFSIISMFTLVLLLAACNADDTKKDTNESKQKEDALSVYTTVYPLQYFTEQIGGEFVDVSSIYPAGANEHSFEPTQKDMMALADADLFFYIGLGLEGFVENAQKTLANEDVKLVATAANVTEDQLHISTGHTHAEHEEHDDHGHEEEHAHEEHDAHVWLSPIISQQLALTIKDELVKALPEHEATFNSNYEQLVTDLAALHSDFEEMAAATKKKTFFVSHAAFGYIAGHYGFNQVPVAGLNSQSEPSQKELTVIVDLANKENIQYIFFEQNVSSKLTEIIQKEVNAETLTLHNLSVLTKEDIQNNEDYFTLMRKNMDVLKQALSN
ncbi:putative zinc transport system zinc-binding lipoprotein AdcA precursor [Solibacillus isronensis B3W22]|uniref:Putative zinc transport system zinc-binding lipoprotein AdcA n=1 Tax=Solibacillus isronensis B3W22 TaxID=1224748 RepID=K1KZ83_9BACL|nr:zinc ABC transporter substrate-binding protein [Solibacillus isronensis]AMO86438.1 adhesin [Solibacillus silvestris]EKB43823.1 putative zinc transport system zinc-binding lipoprotein AdcA precursor [Solibacillus isronensis B3W22]